MRFVIKGRMAGMNEYTLAMRKNRFVGADMKKNFQNMVEWAINNSSCKVDSPVFLVYHFYEPNRRRDKDNVSAFAHKVIQDALVHLKVIKNDGWNDIAGYIDLFDIDENNPRIEVEMLDDGVWEEIKEKVGY